MLPAFRSEEGRHKENKEMLRIESLLVATLLAASAPAFAADTPDPSSKGGSALPSGSNAAVPNQPPPDNAANPNAGQDNKSATSTSPGEENKGKPTVQSE
jgi:hypothetical protein